MGTLAEAESAVRAAALGLVQTPDGRVRVEDYLTVIAAAAGEASLAAAGFDVEGHDLTPGSGLFFDPVNAVLTGDPITRPAAPGTVWSLIEPLGGSLAPVDALPDPAALYRFVVEHLGAAGWGRVSTSVDADHHPTVLPLQAAYDLRTGVLEVERRFGAPVEDRHIVTTAALTAALEETRAAIDVPVALQLAVEVLFGMAKMAPMTVRAMATVAQPVG